MQPKYLGIGFGRLCVDLEKGERCNAKTTLIGAQAYKQKSHNITRSSKIQEFKETKIPKIKANI